MADIQRAETPQQKYDAALNRLEELKKHRETLSGKANRKKRTAYNKKIKALEETLPSLKAATSRDTELEFRIKELQEQRAALTGAQNKKKRAALNKKIQKAQAELENLKNPNQTGAEDSYEPPIPDNWLQGKIRDSDRKALIEKGAKFVCNEVNGQYLKNVMGLKNGKQRSTILSGIAELKSTLDWLPPLTEPINVQTITQGDGCTYPKKGDTLHVLYRGVLRRNPEICFDETGDRKSPFKFQVGVGGVIRGWEEGLPKLSLLEKARLTIRNDYAYGPRQMGQNIPPYSDLIFEVELVGIERDGVVLEPGHERHEAEKKRIAERQRQKAEREAKEAAEREQEENEENKSQKSDDEDLEALDQKESSNSDGEKEQVEDAQKETVQNNKESTESIEEIH